MRHINLRQVRNLVAEICGDTIFCQPIRCQIFFQVHKSVTLNIRNNCDLDSLRLGISLPYPRYDSQDIAGLQTIFPRLDGDFKSASSLLQKTKFAMVSWTG